MNTPTTAPVRQQIALPRSSPPQAGAPEESTWSTRSAASMNDVDTDKHRQTLPSEEGRTPPTPETSNVNSAPITCIMPN
jgi:hypothetical protein